MQNKRTVKPAAATIAEWQIPTLTGFFETVVQFVSLQSDGREGGIMQPAFAIIGTSLALWTYPAQASNACGPRDIVVERLASKYGEHARALGLDTNNGVVEVYANIESGSWTITVTSITGLTCLIASGLSFEGLNAARDVPDEDA